MTILSAYKSDTGRKRAQNEDYVWVDEQMGLYIVADGMGGHEAGDVASKLASTTIGALVSNQLKAKTEPLSEATIKTLITGAIEAANETVSNAAKEADQKRRMGSTIVVALVRLPAAYISHAGDARAYLIRGSTLMQLTEDDSWAAQLAAAGADSNGEERSRKIDHIITKAVGQDSKLSPSFAEVRVAPGDWLLLCSDGLWGMVEDEQILAEIQKAGDDPTRAAEALVAAANAAGGNDNISVALIRIVSVEH